MKNRIKRKFMSGILIMAFLLGSLSAVATAAEPSAGFVLPTGDLAVHRPSQPMELLSASDVEGLNEQIAGYTPQQTTLLINNARSYYYYNKIGPIAKEIYDVMYEVAKDPVSEGNIGLVMTDMDPNGEEFYREFNVAYRAICFDHPELFWLYSGEEAEMVYSSEAINQNGFYFVYIRMLEPFAAFEEQMTAFNQATSAFLADIDTGISEYETIRQVHDKLIAMVNYNDPVVKQIKFGNGQDLAHTAYGALVTDSSGNPNYAVCDGYTLALEYLLQQCGINVVFIGGMAGASMDTVGGHAWNIIEMDGVWYETDATWDDAESVLDDLMPGSLEYQYTEEALNDPVYREKVDHFMFLISTEEIQHFVPGEEYHYTTKDQQYIWTLVGESVRYRMEEDGSGNVDPSIIALAPVAMQSYR